VRACPEHVSHLVPHFAPKLQFGNARSRFPSRSLGTRAAAAAWADAVSRTAVSTALLLAACLLSAGCAGYHVGNQSLYPTHIRTVYVPIFDSVSFRPHLGERLTEAVQKQIELKTPYKVVGTPDADSVLSGRIVGETKHLTVQTRQGQPRAVETELAVEVTWLDRRGQVIRRGPAVPLPPQAVDVRATADVIPEIGRSVATAHQDAIGQVAQEIVSLMEAPW
jgi:outer membrane lipopolysaccharide assembly protein LptE/RlpB